MSFQDFTSDLTSNATQWQEIKTCIPSKRPLSLALRRNLKKGYQLAKATPRKLEQGQMDAENSEESSWAQADNQNGISSDQISNFARKDNKITTCQLFNNHDQGRQAHDKANSRSKQLMQGWTENVRGSFVKIIENHYKLESTEVRPSVQEEGINVGLKYQNQIKSKSRIQCINLTNKADKFLNAVELSDVHASFNYDQRPSKDHRKSLQNKSQKSGCFLVNFKTGIKIVSHVISFQSQMPFQSTAEKTTPICYVEMKVLSFESKEVNYFGIGLACADFPMLKAVGAEKSIGIRGDARIHQNNEEQKIDFALRGVQVDLRKKGSTVGIGFIFMTQTVFFTVNGKEVYQMSLPQNLRSKMESLYPTFSLGGLNDRVQINFGTGKTQFHFDLARKVNDYYKKIYSEIKTSNFSDTSFQTKSLPTKTMDLVRDYLQCQGYFRTLNALERRHEKPTVSELECQQSITHQEHSTPNKSDIKIVKSKGNSAAKVTNSGNNHQKSGIGSFQALAGKSLTASPELVSKTMNERDASFVDEQQLTKRESRLDSFITDRDPSLLPQSSIAQSDRDIEANLQQSGEFLVHQQQQALEANRNKTYQIYKEVSFGRAPSVKKRLSQASNMILSENSEKQSNNLKENQSDSESNYSPSEPVFLMRDKVLRLIKDRKYLDAITFLKKNLSSFYQTCRPGTITAILSLQFVQLMREQRHAEAIKLIQQSEMQKYPFPSVDADNRPVVRTVKDLSKIFCCPNVQQSSDQVPRDREVSSVLLSSLHSNAVIEFVNSELLSFEKLASEEKSATIDHQNSCSPILAANNRESEDAESFGTKRNVTSLVSNKQNSQNQGLVDVVNSQRKRDQKRDSKLARMMKHTALALNHLNQSLPERQKCAQKSFSADDELQFLSKIVKKGRLKAKDASTVKEAQLNGKSQKRITSKTQSELAQLKHQHLKLNLDQHTGIQLRHQISCQLDQLDPGRACPSKSLNLQK